MTTSQQPPIEPITTQPKNGGTQRLYRFDNGYGASVIQGPFSYGHEAGLWELAVIKWDSDKDFELTYDTTVTSDVIGHLDEDEIQETLVKIQALGGDE